MAKEPFPLDRGWAWAIVAGSFVCVFFMVGTAKSTGMFLLEFQSHFGVPTSLAAMMMGGSAIVYAFMAPVFIMLGQTFCVRRVVICGATIGFVGMSLGSLLFSMEYVIATFGICFGIGNASIYGNVLVILGVYFHRRRTLANGLALTGASIGQFVMPPFIEFLLESYGLQGTLLMISGVYFHVVAAACLFRPPSFYATQEELSGAPPAAVEEDAAVNGQENGPLVSPSASNGKANGTVSMMGDGDKLEAAAAVRENGAGGNSYVKDDSVYGNTNPTSPLVPSSPKTVGFVDGGGREESPSTVLTYRSFMASNGSLCMRPLSVYGSSMLVEPHDLQMEEWKDEEEKKGAVSLWHKVASMFDFRLMQSYVAVFITLTNFLGFFGYFNFVLFLPATVMSRGITKYDKAILVSACGVGDLVGRLATAAIGDSNYITRYKLQALGIMLVSLNMGMFIFADTLGWMIAHCALYGIFGGVYVSLAAVVIIDFVGLKKMPKLLAVVMLIQGVGASIGQPFLGWVRDATGSFQTVVAICTAASLLGGLLLLAYPLVLKLEQRRPENYRLLPETTIITCVKI